MHRWWLFLALMAGASRLGAQERAQFDDANELIVPVRELDTEAREVSGLAGVRGSTSRLPTDSADAGPNVLFLLALHRVTTTFERRPLSLGRYERFRISGGIGYGYEAQLAYEIGPFVTTDSQGDGAFFVVGVDLAAASLGKSEFSELFIDAPLGYLVQSRRFALELSVIPSAGDVSAGLPHFEFDPHAWLRQRARIRALNLLLEAEHGQSLAPSTERYWEASLCAATGKVPLVSCTSARHVERDADPIASATEVSISLGFGGIHATRGVATR